MDPHTKNLKQIVYLVYLHKIDQLEKWSSILGL